MSVVAAALSVPAGVSFGLLLLGAAGAAYSLWSLSRLRQHYRLVEAAERQPAVSLNYVVRRYVPRTLRSHQRAEEILLAKQIIDARRTKWKRWAMASALLVACSVGTTIFLVHRNLPAVTAAPAAAKVLPSDPLTAIAGVWGWRADSSRSCTENPQVISVSSDRKRVSTHYAKPIQIGTHWDYDVSMQQPGMLVLSLPVGSSPRPISISIKFLDADTFIATSSERPLETTGAIERCK